MYTPEHTGARTQLKSDGPWRSMSHSPELGVGSPAPQFRLPGSTGQDIGLADYADKAHVILFFVREFN